MSTGFDTRDPRFKVRDFLRPSSQPLTSIDELFDIPALVRHDAIIGRRALRALVVPDDPWRHRHAVVAQYNDERALAIRAEVLRRGLLSQKRNIVTDAGAAGTAPELFTAIDGAIEKERPYVDEHGILVRGNNPLRTFGIDTRYAQFATMTRKLIAGVPTEYEGPGIYAIRHLDDDGKYRFDARNLELDDLASLVTTRYLSPVMHLISNARMTSMGDDLTTARSDQPTNPDAERSDFNYQERAAFAVDQLRLFAAHGLLSPEDVLGVQAVIYSEAGLSGDLYTMNGGSLISGLAHRLMKMSIRDAGTRSRGRWNDVRRSLQPDPSSIKRLNLLRVNVDGEVEAGQSHVDAFMSRGVPLSYYSGKPSCPHADALRSSSYHDTDIMKVVPIGTRHTRQQHQVYALLALTGCTDGSMYHNVFLDPNHDHFGLAYGVVAMMHQAVERYLDDGARQGWFNDPRNGIRERQLPKMGSPQIHAFGLNSRALQSIRGVL